MEELFIQKRQSNYTNKIRKEGNVSGVIYGRNLNNVMFQVGQIELNIIISDVGEHGVIDVNCEEQDYKVLIKEVQRDPVKINAYTTVIYIM